MRQFWTALYRTPQMWVLIPISYLAGLVTMLPLGYDLSPNAATAIAAGVTSIAAVGGSMVVWNYQERQRRQSIGGYFRRVLEIPLESMRHFEQLFRSSYCTRKGYRETIESSFEEMNALVVEVKDRITESRDLFSALDPQSMKVLMDDYYRAMRQMKRETQRVRDMLDNSVVGLDPATCGRGWLFEINRYRRIADHFGQFP